MNKKILAIAIIGMFVLMSTTSLLAVGMKTTYKPEDGVDLSNGEISNSISADKIEINFLLQGSYRSANAECHIFPSSPTFKARSDVPIIVNIKYDLSHMTNIMHGYKIESWYDIRIGVTGYDFSFSEEDTIVGYWDETGKHDGKYKTVSRTFTLENPSFGGGGFVATASVKTTSYRLTEEGKWAQTGVRSDYDSDTQSIFFNKEKNKAVNTPFFDFLQQHPIIFQLFQRFLRL